MIKGISFQGGSVPAVERLAHELPLGAIEGLAELQRELRQLRSQPETEFAILHQGTAPVIE